VEIGSFDFQGLWKSRRGLFPVGFSMVRHFLGPLPPPSVLCGEPQFLEQLALGLLHAACSVSVAERAGDALQGVDGIVPVYPVRAGSLAESDSACNERVCGPFHRYQHRPGRKGDDSSDRNSGTPGRNC